MRSHAFAQNGVIAANCAAANDAQSGGLNVEMNGALRTVRSVGPRLDDRNGEPTGAMSVESKTARNGVRKTDEIDAPRCASKSGALTDAMSAGSKIARTDEPRRAAIAVLRNVVQSGAPTAEMIDVMSVVRTVGLNAVQRTVVKTGAFVTIHTIADTIAAIATRTMTAITEITETSIGITVVTTMAIIIADTIVDTISGTIRRAPSITVDTGHSTTIRDQPSAMCMTAIMCRIIGSVDIMATTIIRSSSVITIIGASTIRRMAITGFTIMTAATPSSLRSQPARSSGSSSVHWPTSPTQIPSRRSPRAATNTRWRRTSGCFHISFIKFAPARAAFTFH